MTNSIKSDEQWRKELTSEEYRITRQKGTERAFSGEYWQVTGKSGIYLCKCCGEALFDAGTKYDSGSGWPSFFEPLARDKISEHSDTSLSQPRIEIECARCGAHLGHVFPDGPAPTGLRYCVNSASLKFAEAKEDGKPA